MGSSCGGVLHACQKICEGESKRYALANDHSAAARQFLAPEGARKTSGLEIKKTAFRELLLGRLASLFFELIEADSVYPTVDNSKPENVAEHGE
jgi:hypothetical protein